MMSLVTTEFFDTLGFAFRLLCAGFVSLLFLKLTRQFMQSQDLKGNYHQDAKPAPIKPPCLKRIPILGNAHQILKTSWDVKDMPPETYTLQAINGMIHLFEQNGLGIQSYKLGSEVMINFFTPETAEKILRSNDILDKSSLYDYMVPWLGNGLISSKAKQWRKHRKLLTPAFHFKILDEFQPMISDKSAIFVSELKKQLDSDFVDIEPLVAYYTMDVICETAMGINIDIQQKKNSAYVTALKRAGRLTFKRIMTPYLWNSFLFKYFPTGRKFYQCLKEIDDFVNKVIEDRIESLRESEVVEAYKHKEDIMKAAKNGRLTFLDMLVLQYLVDSDSLTKDDIRDEVHTFMFAGQDTTEVAITWTLFLLGNYPEAQEKLYEEIRYRFGSDKDGPITIEDFKEMPYLEAVIKETLRLYPSVPFIARTANKEMIIDGVIIPKGATCAVPLVYLHKNPKEFPDPERFIPERFLPENSGGRHPYAHVPFSAGPRNCIGQRFALLEEKSVITNTIRNFRLISVDQVDKIAICPELVSRPSKQIRIKLVPR